MKSNLTSLVAVLLLLSILPGCAPGPNQSKGSSSRVPGRHNVRNSTGGSQPSLVAAIFDKEERRPSSKSTGVQKTR
jgi:hypothetical protein